MILQAHANRVREVVEPGIPHPGFKRRYTISECGLQGRTAQSPPLGMAVNKSNGT